MANTPGSPDPRFAGANNAWLVFRSLDSYRPRFLTCDLVAGLTLAAIAIPEQMATARLGGFSPEIGFFAFLGGSLAFAFFGNNRFLSCGADSTITPIFAGGLTLLAASGSAEYAVLAARSHARGMFAAQIPIAEHAARPTERTSRDFVPWRFSDAGRRSAWLDRRCRRPKTCT